MPNPVEVVKRAAVEAVEAGKPVNILFGTVLSASPLKIQVDQKSIYTSKMLILTRNVIDFEVDMTVNHSTEDKAAVLVRRLMKPTNTPMLARNLQGSQRFEGR